MFSVKTSSINLYDFLNGNKSSNFSIIGSSISMTTILFSVIISSINLDPFSSLLDWYNYFFISCNNQLNQFRSLFFFMYMVCLLI